MAEPSSDESAQVLAEYLELFHCLGYRYKYFLAPNAILEWFGSRHVCGALPIHEFLLRKFQMSQLTHVNFDEAITCGPIERNDFQMTTQHLPSHSRELIDPRNKVTGITSLKLRAESDIESDAETKEMLTTSGTVDAAEHSPTLPPRSIAEATPTTPHDLSDSDDDDDDSSAPSRKRVRYSTPPPTPFKYLRRLPAKRRRAETSDDDSSSDEYEEEHKKRQNTQTNDYTTLRYLEAIGKLREIQAGGECKEQPIRLRLSYRRNLKNQTLQFALVIYERFEQKFNSKRRLRLPDFTKCVDEDNSSAEDDPLECLDIAQPAVILSTRDGEEHETIATVATPSSAEIATALEEAAFSIQPPVQRTPTKATPIPPGTPKRRPRSAIVGAVSGVAPLASGRKLNRPSVFSGSGKAPKLSAARSLRL